MVACTSIHGFVCSRVQRMSQGTRCLLDGQRGLAVQWRLSLSGRAVAQGWMIFFFSPQNSTLSPQSIFYPLYLNEGSRIWKIRLSKLHCRFKRYASLISLCFKSTMQLTQTSFPDSATFIEKKRVENRLWRKSKFLWRKKIKRSRLAAFMV